MPRRLLTVEDAFEIQGRGLVLAPDFDLVERTLTKLRIEVRRPDGSNEKLDGRITINCAVGGKVVRQPRHILELPVPKGRVPVGSEIWTVDE